MATIAAPSPTTAPATAPVDAARRLVADVLSEHHTATTALGGGLYVWACLCGAHNLDGATDHPPHTGRPGCTPRRPPWTR